MTEELREQVYQILGTTPDPNEDLVHLSQIKPDIIDKLIALDIIDPSDHYKDAPTNAEFLLSWRRYTQADYTGHLHIPSLKFTIDGVEFICEVHEEALLIQRQYGIHMPPMTWFEADDTYLVKISWWDEYS